MDEILVSDILAFLDEYAPERLKESYDNVGLLVGDQNRRVTKILVGLELTDSFIDYAIKGGYNLIVVHHPLIFKPLQKVNGDNAIGRRVMRLIKEDINLIAMHTNLDRAIGGLNDYVCELLGVKVIHPLTTTMEDELPVFRIGKVKKQQLVTFIEHVKNMLDLDYVHFVGNQEKVVTSVGVCTGSGMSYYNEIASKEIDIYITGDMKYHDAMLALDVGVPIIDASHFGTEVVVGKLLHHILSSKYENNLKIDIFNMHVNPIQLL